MPEILDFDITGGFVTVRTDDLKTTAFPASAVWMVRTNIEQVSPVDYSITFQMHSDAQVSFFGPEEIVGALAGDLLHEMRSADEMRYAIGQAKFPERVAGEVVDMVTWQRVTSLIDNRLLQLTRQHAQLEEKVRVSLLRDKAASDLIDRLFAGTRETAVVLDEVDQRLVQHTDDIAAVAGRVDKLSMSVRNVVDAVGQ